MNLLLINKEQLKGGTVEPDQRQATHLLDVLRVRDGDSVRIGCIDGLIGTGTVQFKDNRPAISDIILTAQPPPLLPITLILAMPRPQMLKRILQTVSCMGVTRLCFIQTSRVEKSFWQSPVATDESIKHYLTIGLEQGMATQLPKVEKFTRFRPFVEDQLDNISHDSLKYIAHPMAKSAIKEHEQMQKLTLAIGPEGGFLTKEVDAFVDRGFVPVHLGRRILRVETAVTVCLAKLFTLGNL